MSPVGIGAIDMDNTFGYVVLVVLIVAAYFRIRSRRRTRQQSQAPVLYRGTELYRQSLDNINVAPFVRQAQGLPLYHDEKQWRDPPN
jgi:hypothetical protein